MNSSVFIAGLPGAGKTTFLAALWHLVRSGEVPTELTYAGLEGIDVKYLNSITAKWLEHKEIGRTKAAQEQVARINLRDRDGNQLSLSLPDFAGEGFKRMWEFRRTPAQIVTAAQSSVGHLILINAERVVYPMTTDEYREQLGEAQSNEPEKPFEMNACPTAAKLSDVVYWLEETPIEARPRRTAFALTAWDAVADEGLTPREMLQERLPLLHQMMESRRAQTEYRVYGVSAQGGSYNDFDADCEPEMASERIKLVCDDTATHDLTRMLAWLLG